MTDNFFLSQNLNSPELLRLIEFVCRLAPRVLCMFFAEYNALFVSPKNFPWQILLIFSSTFNSPTHQLHIYQYSCFFHEPLSSNLPETNNADETQTNGDVKVNGTDSDSHAPVTSQKYSQILGDHHTNSSTQQFSRNSSSHHIYKSRGYNNKENNFYNQRSGARTGTQRSWQRGGNYRTSFKKPEEAEKSTSSDAKVDSTAEPIKFNEGKSTQKKIILFCSN